MFPYNKQIIKLKIWQFESGVWRIVVGEIVSDSGYGTGREGHSVILPKMSPAPSDQSPVGSVTESSVTQQKIDGLYKL